MGKASLLLHQNDFLLLIDPGYRFGIELSSLLWKVILSLIILSDALYFTL